MKDGGIVGSFGEMYLSYSLVLTDFCVINRNLYIYIYILCIYIYIYIYIYRECFVWY